MFVRQVNIYKKNQNCLVTTFHEFNVHVCLKKLISRSSTFHGCRTSAKIKSSRDKSSLSAQSRFEYNQAYPVCNVHLRVHAFIYIYIGVLIFNQIVSFFFFLRGTFFHVHITNSLTQEFL